MIEIKLYIATLINHDKNFPLKLFSEIISRGRCFSERGDNYLSSCIAGDRITFIKWALKYGEISKEKIHFDIYKCVQINYKLLY